MLNVFASLKCSKKCYHKVQKPSRRNLRGLVSNLSIRLPVKQMLLYSFSLKRKRSKAFSFCLLLYNSFSFENTYFLTRFHQSSSLNSREWIQWNESVWSFFRHRFQTLPSTIVWSSGPWTIMIWTEKIKDQKVSSIVHVLLIKMPLHAKPSLSAYVISGERSANRPKQLRNDAFHVKTSQSAKN